LACDRRDAGVVLDAIASHKVDPQLHRPLVEQPAVERAALIDEEPFTYSHGCRAAIESASTASDQCELLQAIAKFATDARLQLFELQFKI
jgi:hypothetical protein